MSPSPNLTPAVGAKQRRPPRKRGGGLSGVKVVLWDQRGARMEWQVQVAGLGPLLVGRGRKSDSGKWARDSLPGLGADAGPLKTPTAVGGWSWPCSGRWS